PPGGVSLPASPPGTLLDSDGYTLTLSGIGNAIIALPPNGTVTMPGLRPGLWQVEVTGVASNCHWGTSSPVRIDSAATSILRIDVQCSAPSGVGQIEVVVRTTAIAVSAPSSYLVSLDGNPGINIASSGSVTLNAVPVGSHRVSLLAPPFSGGGVF